MAGGDFSDTEEAQRGVIAFLSDPNTHGGHPVAVRSTPTSHVFLAGANAYKLKRARKMPFLDYSTLELRHALCRRELELNRRTAPDIYLDVLPVTEKDGRLHLGGPGAPVEWVLHMRRFADEDLADYAAATRRFRLSHALELADTLAAFHKTLPPCHDKGGAAAFHASLLNVRAAFAMASDADFTAAACELADALIAIVSAKARAIDTRKDQGFVRLCHGDMHLGNIALINDHPVPFDAIEFSDDIACVDTLHDMAFPLMDMVAHDLPLEANGFLNRYLMATRDMDGLSLLPLYLGYRALVRAMATGLVGKLDRGRHYLATARQLMAPRMPWVVAVGGLSGSGKSTVARALALDLTPMPGALMIRSDEVRKRLFGQRPEERLGKDAYAPAVSEQVFTIMRQDATRALGAGWPVILDATHMDPAARQAAEAVAKAAGAPFCGLWLEAPADVLRQRVGGRDKDISDADLAVLEKQLAVDVGDIGWPKIAADGPPERVIADAEAAVRFRLGMLQDSPL